MLHSRWFWLISVIQLLLFIFLIWHGCVYQPTWLAWIGIVPENAGEQTSGMGTIRMDWIDTNDMPLLEQVAQGLNFPADLIGELLVAPIDLLSEEQLTGAERELLSHAFTAALIPILWYSVIRAAISRDKFRSRPSGFLKTIVIVAIGILLLLSILIISSFWIGDSQPQIIMKILVLIWISWGLYMLMLRIRVRGHQQIGATE